MPKDHRKWVGVVTYCKTIPISASLKSKVKALVKEGKNVLILIKKEDHELYPKHTPGEKFTELCNIFNDEMTLNKLIISTVPDLTKIIEID